VPVPVAAAVLVFVAVVEKVEETGLSEEGGLGLRGG